MKKKDGEVLDMTPLQQPSIPVTISSGDSSRAIRNKTRILEAYTQHVVAENSLGRELIFFKQLGNEFTQLDHQFEQQEALNELDKKIWQSKKFEDAYTEWRLSQYRPWNKVPTEQEVLQQEIEILKLQVQKAQLLTDLEDVKRAHEQSLHNQKIDAVKAQTAVDTEYSQNKVALVELELELAQHETGIEREKAVRAGLRQNKKP